ncbi:hypothetical protein [Methylobacterium aquaticum]|jgi:hypothetical protein|uniref:Uncharacterized protein n=1 Tax=Methylobacterium aquaticum TaxID=270351 RepID=A0A0J6SQM0_9HYPH|nr:hypothetical protein [Methylobacterium aquaticum]KMO37515.1 hypothetical protein VP06_08305 [Methylobacterium aquaticum]
MTTLHENSAETVTPARVVVLGVVAFATLAVLSLVWWTFSPVLGRIYAVLRLIESASLWRFTGWGRYFTGMPVGEPFAYVSIYKSSVAFGLVAALLTALVGYFAWRKRSRHHIEALITLPRLGFGREEIGSRFMPADRVMRVPDKDQEAFQVQAGVPNTFKGVRDLLDARAVETELDAIPWHLAGALFLTIDAVAPLTDRKARDAVLKAVRAAADRHAANPLAEQPVTLLPTLYGALLQAITERNGREDAPLRQVHEVLEQKEGLAAAVSALAAAALAMQRIHFPDYAWLRHVDPNLQSAITAY